MLATSNASDCVDDECQESPEKSGYHGKRPAERLHRQTCAVGVRNVVGAVK